MKIVEEWSYEGYLVKIEARFETESYNISEAVFGEDYIDCVRLKATIEKDITVETIREVASSRTHYVKNNFLSRKKYLSLHESYESALVNIKHRAVKYIEEQLRQEKIRKSDREITDGIPDSLKGL